MTTDTAERLKRNREKIIELWKERAYKEIKSALGLESLVLANALQSYLDDIAEALTQSSERTTLQLAAAKLASLRYAQRHGANRADSFLYTLAEMIMEFHILREVIFQVMEEEAALTAKERDIILSSIEQTVNDAASQFAETQRETQERFTLTLAHDLRNPIAAAKTHAQLIERNPADAENSLRAARKINEKMNRLEAMLRELLDVSRIKAGEGLALEVAEMRLDLLAKEVANEISATHGGRLELHADEPVAGVWNRDGLRRILENLIVNALKYGSQQAPVSISVKQKDQDAILIVHNEGKPIPVKEQSKLFEKFKRAAGARSGTGWGLGLALVNGMVKAHKGSVRVESSQEAGTNFIVELPKRMHEGPTESRDAERVPGAT